MNFKLSDDDNKLSSLNKIENCVSEVRMWMNANFLKVNEDQTVALVHASINNQAKHKAGHRSTLAFLRFCVIAATGIRKHTQVELLDYATH